MSGKENKKNKKMSADEERGDWSGVKWSGVEECVGQGYTGAMLCSAAESDVGRDIGREDTG